MFLVTGATGSLGRRIVHQLREQNKSVRAFVRLSSHYQDLEKANAEIFIGDLKQDKDIKKAIQGIKYVISCHGSGNDSQAIDYRANIELIDQAKENKVEHFVFISVIDADKDYEESTVFKAKKEVEKYLIKSGLNYTILRSSGFANNLLPLARRFRETGFYLLIGDANNRASTVSTDDLATIAIASVSVADAKNKTIPVGGPEIIKRGEIAKIFARVFHKEPFIVNPPLDLFDGVRMAIGIFNPDLKKSLGTLRTLLAHEFYCTPEEIANLESIYDIKMESLENYLKRNLAN